MAMARHLMLAWVWQGTADDPRTGFVVMTRPEFLARGERAQDPRVGALNLKFQTRALWEPPPEPEA